MNQAQVAKCNQIAGFLRRRITFIPTTAGIRGADRLAATAANGGAVRQRPRGRC